MISVIICSCGRLKTIQKTVESLLKAAQKYPDTEILVIANPHSQALESLIEKYDQTGKTVRVRYIQEHEKGISRARNRGISEAESDIIAFVDDDAWVDENWLYLIDKTFKEHECIGCAGKINPVFEQPVPEWIKKWQLQDKYNGIFVRHDLGKEILNYKIGMRMPFTTNVAFKRQCFEVYGKFRADLEVSEDMEFSERLLNAGEAIIYNPGIIVFHQTDVSRLSKLYFKKWHFRAGRSDAKRHSKSGSVYVLNIPGYIIKLFLRHLINSIAYMALLNRKMMFVNQLKVNYYLGFMFGRIVK